MKACSTQIIEYMFYAKYKMHAPCPINNMFHAK